ncbi:MAG: hypothetical protein AAEJ53_20550, partial [Myxococcota bacterium]
MRISCVTSRLDFLAMAGNRSAAALGTLFCLATASAQAAPIGPEQLYASDGGGKLYALDAVTGGGALVGSGIWVGSGLAFAPSGELYASNGGGALYQLDPVTGGGTLIGAGSWVGSGLAFAP